MGKGWFITFEGTEGSGKSTQILRLAERLRQSGHSVRRLREPGGTPIGEEIRHTLQHSHQNAAMTREAELLLINASRAQLVREVIRPALVAGETVLCDRYYDSTTAYQGYGRQLDLAHVESIIAFATGGTRPDLTLLLWIPTAVSEERRRTRLPPANADHGSSLAASPAVPPPRDRMEEAGRDFFERVEAGYRAIAAAEPARVVLIDGTRSAEEIEHDVWRHVEALLSLGTT